MYAIYGNIYHQYTPTVSIYTIHGSYGIITSELRFTSRIRRKQSIPIPSEHEPRRDGETLPVAVQRPGSTHGSENCSFLQINGWLVVDLPIWKIWKSVGMMTFPIYGKIKNVPNHQPDWNYIGPPYMDIYGRYLQSIGSWNSHWWNESKWFYWWNFWTREVLGYGLLTFILDHLGWFWW